MEIIIELTEEELDLVAGGAGSASFISRTRPPGLRRPSLAPLLRPRRPRWPTSLGRLRRPQPNALSLKRWRCGSSAPLSYGKHSLGRALKLPPSGSCRKPV